MRSPLVPTDVVLTCRGSRFGYTNYYPQAPDPHDPVPPVKDSSPASTSTLELSRKVTSGGVEIWKSIQYMDHEGIEILRTPGAKGKVEEWAGYLRRTGVGLSFEDPLYRER